MLHNTFQERRAPGRIYTDEEWEQVKEPFRHYYIEKNMPLRAAAKQISREYGFEATPRQWERRIAPEKWNFPKYANRDERLKQIQESGKSLLEVSNRGRRKSVASDGRPTINEDRNLRRFARREVSRRPRAQSVGNLSDASDQEMSNNSVTASPAPSDSYHLPLDTISPFPAFDSHDTSGDWTSKPTLPQDIVTPRIEIYDTTLSSQNPSVPQITFSGPDDLKHIVYLHDSTTSQADGTFSHPPSEPDDLTYQDFPNTTFSQQYIPEVHDTNAVDIDPNWPADTYDSVTSTTNNDLPQLELDQMSFTELMNLDEPHISTVSSSFGNHMKAFNNTELHLSEPNESAVVTEDVLPDFDDTHRDVHDLLDDHFNKISQMVQGCLNGCEKFIVGHDPSIQKAVMDHLKLLQNGIAAQSRESNMNIRNTLHNISLTQRRATRSIYELSMRRKKQIEMLKSQNKDIIF